MGEKKEKVELRFWEAEEAAKIAETLEENHKDLWGSAARILWRFREPGKSGKGKTELAHTTLIPRALRDLCDGEFLVVINHDQWAEHEDDAWRARLVDHELSHMEVVVSAERGETYAIRHHDVQDFLEVIRRNGFTADQEPLKQMLQMNLFEKTAKAKTAKKTEKEKADKLAAAAGGK